MYTLALVIALDGYSKQFGRYAIVSLCRTPRLYRTPRLLLISIWTSGDQFAKWSLFERVAYYFASVFNL